MKIVVLISKGRHPGSGKPAPVPVELQAIRLGAGLGETRGLHAGDTPEAALETLGFGLTLLEICPANAGSPLAALTEALRANPPDLILAGRRGVGGSETGMLPYALAQALGWTIVADAASIEPGETGTIIVEQALARGARRRVTVRLPAVVTVHPAARPAPAFAQGAARRGIVRHLEGVHGEPAVSMIEEIEERPYRKRPKLIGGSAGGSASDRLKAATQSAKGGGRVLLNPSPEDAARAILDYLRQLGLARKL